MRVGLGSAALVAAACIAGCSGGGGGGSSPPVYTVGGTVTGLSGSGLVLRVNGGGNLSVSGNTFAFGGFLAGTTYSVTVFTQPTNPSQTCAVTSGGTGTVAAANVTDVAITCTTSSFTVGGKVNALLGAGMVLQNNGGNNLAINSSGAFTFSAPVLSGAGYAVTILTQPAGQTCHVSSGTGTVGAGNVTGVDVACGFSVATVGDPLATQQWHLKNTGQNGFSDVNGVAGNDINVDPVFTNFGFTGLGVTVGVVDSGLEIAHEDLAANVVPGGSWNFNTGTTDPTNTVDIDGDHGTSVSGLIAMAMGNAKGGIGVAPRAGLKGFNFISSNQSQANFLASLGASTSNPNSSDVFIFNQSFGIDTNTPELVIPQDEAQYLSGVTTLRGGKGALYVKAAGNGFNSVGPPPGVTCPGTLSCENANFDPSNTLPYQVVVGAIAASGFKASYSTAGSAIWVSAPGGEFGRNAAQGGAAGTVDVQPAMVTTDQSGCTKGFARTTVNNGSAFDNGGAPNTSCNYTNGMNGTSSATPVTVGVIALILEANPALTWRDVKHILASTARQIDAARAPVNVALTGGTYVAEPAWTTNHATPTPFHYHNWYGFGMVDATAAVNMAKTYAVNLGTLTNTGFLASGTVNASIPNQNVAGATSTISVGAGVQVIEAVQIRVNVTHPFIGELGIELISPTGTRSVLKNILDGYFDADNLSNQIFLSNAFYGENPAGTWTIKVVDGFGQDTSNGTLVNWAIRVYGH